MSDKIYRGELTTTALKEFCRAYKILVPSGASKATYEAAITRAGLHLHDVRLQESDGCFGFWSSDDMNCSLCRYEKECEHVSLGMAAEKYDRAAQKADLPAIEFAERLSKKRPQKRSPKTLD